jgi:hypothetical protein
MSKARWVVSEIVKVQRALAPPDGPALIYAEGRRHIEHVELGELPDWLQAALRTEPKVYCHAMFIGGRWRLDRLLQSRRPSF